MTKPVYNLINQEKLLKSNLPMEEKIVAEAKIEVFETLSMRNRKQIKLDDIALQLSESRWNNGWFPDKIIIGKKEITINQDSYRSIFDNYKNFLGEHNDKWLEWTDWDLAQRLILDSWNMILFEDNQDGAQKTYNELYQDPKYQDKIELLQKKYKKKHVSIIKRTEKEQAKIETIIAEKMKKLKEDKNKTTEIAKNKTNNNDLITDIEYEEIKKDSVENNSESKESLNLWLLVNRDNLADKIRELRNQKKFSEIKEIEIQRWVFITINNNPKIYADFLEKYLQNEWNISELEKLDTQFAETLIINYPDNVAMDQKYWIQINNDEPGKNIKSSEELESEAKRCVDGLSKLGYDVEYIKIEENSNSIKNKELDDMKSYIDELQKSIDDLQSELNAKSLYSDETDRVKKQNDLQKLIDKRNKLQSDFDKLLDEVRKELLDKNNKIYHIVRRKTQKALPPHEEDIVPEEQKALPPHPEQKALPPHEEDIIPEEQKALPPHEDQKILPPHVRPMPIPPTPTPVPPTPTPKNNKRTATISNVENVHMEEANHRAEELAREEYERLGQINLFDIQSWKPWRRMQTYALRSLRRQQRRNRHMASIRWNINLTREDVVNASDRHEMESNEWAWTWAITSRLVNHQNADIDLLCKEYLTTNMLDRDFETRFNNILRLDNTVMTIVGTNNMDYLASNILLKLKNEKSSYEMVNAISTLLNSWTPYNAATFQTQLNTITTRFFSETKQNYPDYIQRILDNITDPIEINRIITHQKALLNEDVKTLQMQLQLLDNTTGAYEIDNQDKERWFWYRFGSWMDRHPYLTIGGSILAGTWILATWWLIGWVAWAATATWLLATKIGMMTASKKASHYTKEQKWQEKRLTHGLNIERQAMDNIRTVMNNAPWHSWRRYKARRQFNLYQESTQRNITDTSRLTDFINRFVAIPGTLPATEETALRNYISNWLARVDYYKEIWHNFVASQDRSRVEIDMRNLYMAITQWVEKLGTNLATVRWSTEYTTLRWDLTTDYSTSMENFQTQRRNLELKYGIWAGMLYAWTAVWLQYIMGSGIFGNYPCGGTETVVVAGQEKLVLHDEVKEALKNAWATDQNITNIEEALKNTPSSASADGYNQYAWRTTVKNEMWWTDPQLNSWMHDFMKDTLWTLNEWWASEFQQQLLDAKINTLTANSSAAKTAEAFLSSPKIALIDQWEWAKVLSDLQSWLSGKDITLFTADEKMKMWYYGHLFIGNDSWVGSRLTEQLTKMTTVWWSTTIIPTEEICNRHYWLDGIGMPVFANTFMERMTPNQNENGQAINAPHQDPVPDPTIVITDENNPASTKWTPTYSWLTGK